MFGVARKHINHAHATKTSVVFGFIVLLVAAVTVSLVPADPGEGGEQPTVTMGQGGLSTKRGPHANFDNGSLSPNNRSHTTEHDGIDFFIAGFPKCGTSTLVYTFKENEETEMPDTEYCSIGRRDRPHEFAIDGLKTMMKKEYSKPSETGKRLLKGMKCPSSIRYIKSVERLEMLNSETKVIVGVRHPVLFFQSYFNYRVVEHHQQPKLRGEPVPHPNTLIGGHEKGWRGVFTDLAKFEDGLMQMGKVALESDDLRRLAEQRLIFAPTRLRIFLYDVDQLSDPQKERAAQFRSSLQNFLTLNNSIEPFEKRNSLAKKGSFPNTMNICDEEFKELRDILVMQGNKTQKWIREEFMKSEDVVIGGDEGHFLELIAEWGVDPCAVHRVGRALAASGSWA